LLICINFKYFVYWLYNNFNIDNVVAHSSKVNCMKISPKSGNIMITGGDDRKIKLWIIGKLKSLAVIFYLVYIFIILKDKQKKKKKK